MRARWWGEDSVVSTQYPEQPIESFWFSFPWWGDSAAKGLGLAFTISQTTQRIVMACNSKPFDAWSLWFVMKLLQVNVDHFIKWNTLRDRGLFGPNL